MMYVILLFSKNIKYILILVSIFITLEINAEDSLTLLMQRMQSDKAIKITYQETRTLELLDQPWHGSGYMYSVSPDLMIREQVEPQRLLMGIKADKMYYFDPGNHVRHQAVMDENDPISLNIVVFKALMNADKNLLKKHYQVEFSQKEQRWLMKLTPKQQELTGFNIVVSGLAEHAADTIVVKQADGDLSEIMLQNQMSGEPVNQSVKQLTVELLGAQ